MFLLKKPVQYTFQGVTKTKVAALLFSDFLYNKTSAEDINVHGEWSDYETEVLPIILQYFGFNPFRSISDFYVINGTGEDTTMDDLVDTNIIRIAETKPAYQYIYVSSGDRTFTNFKTMDNISFDMPYIGGSVPGIINDKWNITFKSLFTSNMLNYRCDDIKHVEMYIQVLPERLYEGKCVIPESGFHAKKILISLQWTNNVTLKYTWIQIKTQQGETFRSILTAFHDSTADDEYVEGIDNPYEVFDGDSGEGGGDGDGQYADIDGIDPAVLPDLPDISAISSGLMTVYMPTAGQLNLLGDFLWSSGFDINDLKKLFADPMSAIIGLSILPISPTSAGSKSVKFGDVDTGITMPYTTNQFVRLSCGSVRISEYVGCFMDYAPYVDIQIYLPGIGMRTLSPDDCMNETLTLTYHVDVLTGGCTAFIQCGSKGILYQFNGSLIANVPLTDKNYSGAIQNAVSAVMSGAGVIAGAVTGAAPLTAMSAVGLAQSAANTAINSKPTIERSGNMGGSAGLMSIQKPYVVINRPDMSVPRNINKFVGNTLNVTKRLNQCKGFTMVQFIHLDGVTATDNEKDELMRLLNEGVII